LQKKVEKQSEKNKEKNNTRKTINFLTMKDQAICHAIEKCAKVKFVATWSTIIVKETNNQSNIKKIHMGYKAQKSILHGF